MGDQHIFLSAQKEVSLDQPTEDDIYKIGTFSKIKQMLKLPNGTIRVLVEGLKRGKINKFTKTERYFEVNVELLEEEAENDLEEEALMRTVLNLFEQYVSLTNKISAETFASVQDITEPGRLADVIASHLTLKVPDKQKILNTVNVKERLNLLISILNNEKKVLDLEKKIGQRVKKSMEKTQKEYYLREQMKAIQKELGEKESKFDEIA